MAHNAPMTYLAAALDVLETCRRPMTAREITVEAINRGLLKPGGKTPEYTMSAALYTCTHEYPAGPVVRVYEQGSGAIRARRGSVRWALKP